MEKAQEILLLIKTAFIAIFSAIFGWLGILAIPLCILLGLNVADYWTGITAAPYRDTEDAHPVKSYKSIRGIQKKVCMYILVIVGASVDWLLSNTLQSAGFAFHWPSIFATVITCWLIFNEIISLLENIEDIGTPIPPFLMPIMKLIRKNITIEGDTENEDIK